MLTSSSTAATPSSVTSLMLAGRRRSGIAPAISHSTKSKKDMAWTGTAPGAGGPQRGSYIGLGLATEPSSLGQETSTSSSIVNLSSSSESSEDEDEAEPACFGWARMASFSMRSMVSTRSVTGLLVLMSPRSGSNPYPSISGTQRPASFSNLMPSSPVLCNRNMWWPTLFWPAMFWRTRARSPLPQQSPPPSLTTVRARCVLKIRQSPA